jgi:undecaprenyl diphosphate synthase
MSVEAEKLLKQIDRTRLPAHVAIIMDGNGRWAKRRHLPRLLGHQAGAKTVRRIVETAGQLGIQVLTLYAFSTENWSRPKSEMDGLMRLLKVTLRKEVSHLNKNNVRLGAIGNIAQLPEDVQEELRRGKEALSHNTGLKLILALNYGGRQDILQACNAILAKGVTSALRKGMRIEYVSKLMTHTNIKTTQIYAKIVNSELDKAMDVFND